MNNEAKKFKQFMMAMLESYATTHNGALAIKNGIVSITFPDDTYVDFTFPHVFDKDGSHRG